MKSACLVAALAATWLTACSDSGDDGFSSLLPPPPLIEPAQAADDPGPFGVGHQRLEAIDVVRENRQLPYDVWYPVDPEEVTDEPRTIYPLQGPLGLTSELAIEDAPVADSRAHPLLIFSHGSGGTNTQSVRLMEALASHGFIVVSPEHTGNTTAEPRDPFEVAGANRLPDVSFMIDTYLGRNDTLGDAFFGRIDPQAIGVVGHSFGGGTSLGAVAGFFGVPSDDRVKAVMPISGVVDVFTEAELAAVEEPVLFLGGTLDTAVPIENQQRGFDALTGSSAVYQVDIQGATHTHFANICDIANWLLDNGITIDLWPSIGAAALLGPYEESCSEDAFPIGEVHRIQNVYAVAFFRRHLLNEAAYDFYLQSDYADVFEPDVTYRARVLAD